MYSINASGSAWTKERQLNFGLQIQMVCREENFFFSCRIEAEQVRTNGYYTSDIKLYLVTECLVQCRVSDGEVQAGREACTHPQIRHKSPFRL